MAFETSPTEDANFRSRGLTTGGCLDSKINGRDRTPGELLENATSLPYPNSNLYNMTLRINLKALRDRYNNPSWHQHLVGTERTGLLQTIDALEAGEVNKPLD